MLSALHHQTPSEQRNFPPSSYNFNNSSIRNNTAGVPDYNSLKRLKITHDGNNNVPSSYLYTNNSMPHSVPRSQPQINIQKPSEPSSPVNTIASTLSPHSSPSPSPQSNVAIYSPEFDFQLYGGDDNLPPQEQSSKINSTQRMPLFTSNASYPTHAGARFNQYGGDREAQWYPANMNHAKLAAQQQFNNGMNGYNNQQHAMARAMQQQQQPSLEDIPDLSPSRSSQMSNSGRPSISDDMPATPGRSPARGEVQYQQPHQGPKLQRTISDAVQDELFNPGILPGNTHAPRNHSRESSQSTVYVNNWFQQAQSQHVQDTQASPTRPMMAMRDTSPFRANSPFHPTHTHEAIQSIPRHTTLLPVTGYPSARSRREMEKEREAEALKIQLAGKQDDNREPPKTISPKDACKDFKEPEGESFHHGSLFENSQPDAFSSGSMSDAASTAGSYHGSLDNEDDIKTEESYGSMATSRRTSNATGLPIDFQMPMFQQTQFNQNLLDTPLYSWPADHSSQGSSSDHSHQGTYQNYGSQSPMFQRPDNTSSDSGAYSCTVHGCPQRFPTAAKMSKHRREAHRHGTPMGRDGMIRSQHMGPHRCTRINPTTNKPCNVIFSRPYDLTRHEDTIHNTNRKKVKCDICNDSKTFSRYDALTRHKKVKHGIDK